MSRKLETSFFRPRQPLPIPSKPIHEWRSARATLALEGQVVEEVPACPLVESLLLPVVDVAGRVIIEQREKFEQLIVMGDTDEGVRVCV